MRVLYCSRRICFVVPFCQCFLFVINFINGLQYLASILTLSSGWDTMHTGVYTTLSLMETACLQGRDCRYCRDLQSTNMDESDEGSDQTVGGATHQHFSDGRYNSPCCTPARSLPATPSPSSCIFHASLPLSVPTHSSSHYPSTPPLPISRHSSPRSAYSLYRAASAVSPPRIPAHLSRAQWRSFTKVTLRLSGATYWGGQRRKKEDGILCGRREMRREVGRRE